MAQTAGANAGVNYGYESGSDAYKNGFDASLILIDQMIQPFVLNTGTSAEPASPAVGDAYILPSTQTGTNWGSDAGAVEDAIAIYTNVDGQTDSSPWLYRAPREGWRVYDRAADQWLVYDGSGWRVAESFAVRSETGTSVSTSNDELEGVLEIDNAGAITLTVEPDTTMTKSRVGSKILVVERGAGNITLAAGSGVTLGGVSGTTAQDTGIWLYKTAANTWHAVTT